MGTLEVGPNTSVALRRCALAIVLSYQPTVNVSADSTITSEGFYFFGPCLFQINIISYL